tara:strand:+ start:268 stop:1035 length:768 start_codon:yes stop_codon:yes gene_type:complete
VKSDREFCQRIDYVSQNLSQIVKGKRDVTIELIRKAVEVFGFNAGFIFSGNGNPLTDITADSSSGVSFDAIRFLPNHDHQKYVKEINENIPGLLTTFQYHSASVPDDVRLFEISENALNPYLYSGDVILCKRIQSKRWDRLIRDFYVHVIISNNDLHLSRIQKDIRKNSQIELLDVLSDEGDPLLLDLEETKEIWEITHVIKRWSREMNSKSTPLNNRIDELGNSVHINGDSIKELNSTIEKLLRQMRELSSQGR